MKIFKLKIFRSENDRYKVLADMIVGLESILSQKASAMIPASYQDKLYRKLTLENNVMICEISDKVIYTRNNATQSDYLSVIEATSLEEIARVFDNHKSGSK